MYTICKIKNLTGNVLTLRGHEFSVDETYTIQESVRKSWAGSDEVITAVTSGDFQIHGEEGAIEGISNQIDWLKSYLPHVTSVESQPPFAEPLYRTKRSRTMAPIYVPPGATKIIDFILPDERYVSGGAIIVENGKFKDSIKASVYDYYEGIPEVYRGALCENWPTVAEYVEGEWLEYDGSQYVVHRINTYPLNAKITQSLSLRVTYSAYEEGLTYKGDWASDVSYFVNDICSYGNKAYKCIQANTNTPLMDDACWVKVESRCILVNYSLTKKLPVG